MKDPKLINDNCSSVSLCNRNRWWFFAVKATAIQEQEITKIPAKKNGPCSLKGEDQNTCPTQLRRGCTSKNLKGLRREALLIALP